MDTEKTAEYEKPPPYTPLPPGMTVPSQPPPSTAQMPPGYNTYPTVPPMVNQPLPTYVPSYGATTITVQPHEIIIVGACPACRVGVLEDDYTCLGIFCAIFFFPLGILACLALKNRRCTNCGAYFG